MERRIRYLHKSIAVGGHIHGLPKIFRASLYRAHRAVIFAITRLSCTQSLIISSLMRCCLYTGFCCWVQTRMMEALRGHHLRLSFAVPVPVAVTSLCPVGREIKIEFVSWFISFTAWLESSRSSWQSCHGGRITKSEKFWTP